MKHNSSFPTSLHPFSAWGGMGSPLLQCELGAQTWHFTEIKILNKSSQSVFMSGFEHLFLHDVSVEHS